jgi:hypothetical protein
LIDEFSSVISRGTICDGTRARYSGAPSANDGELTKMIILGDDGLYLETTPIGDVLS